MFYHSLQVLSPIPHLSFGANFHLLETAVLRHRNRSRRSGRTSNDYPSQPPTDAPPTLDELGVGGISRGGTVEVLDPTGRVLHCHVLPKSTAAKRLAASLDSAWATVQKEAGADVLQPLHGEHDYVTHELMFFDYAIPALRCALRVITPYQMDVQKQHLALATMAELTVAAQLGWDVHIVPAFDLLADTDGAAAGKGVSSSANGVALRVLRDMVQSYRKRTGRQFDSEIEATMTPHYHEVTDLVTASAEAPVVQSDDREPNSYLPADSYVDESTVAQISHDSPLEDSSPAVFATAETDGWEEASSSTWATETRASTGLTPPTRDLIAAK
jgi:hypothetical protein